MPLDINILKELLVVDYSKGPLFHVEDVVIPEPLEIRPKTENNFRIKSTRGRRSAEKWLAEIRKVWRQINDEEKLGESWLSGLAQIQNLAASKYGGSQVGRGLALQEILRKAIVEAQKYTTDERIKELLMKYPRIKMEKIAGQFGLKSREHFSRLYVRKAAALIVRAFQVILSQPM
jgi:hypothetical protein